MSKNEYIPFGEEWRKEMSKWSKSDLIELLRAKLIAEKKQETSVEDILDQYNVYVGDDVATCPRCNNCDITFGNRVCTSCLNQLQADFA